MWNRLRLKEFFEFLVKCYNNYCELFGVGIWIGLIVKFFSIWINWIDIYEVISIMLRNIYF